jgi:hypothetical protein
MGLGGIFRGIGDAAGDVGRGVSDAAAGGARGVGNISTAGRGVGDAGGAAGRGVGDAGGAAGRGVGDAGAAGRAADTPVRQGPPNTPERIAAAKDPKAPDVPSREAGSDWAKNFTAGNAWKATKVVLGVTVVAAGVTITAIMLDKAKKGADNNGKTYKITSIKNKDAFGNTITCTFSPAIEPNGVVVQDSITISGTGTALDGNSYTITKKTASHSTVEFDASARLSAEVKSKGSFVLNTSMENQLDNQANELGTGLGGFFGNLFSGLFSGLAGGAGILAIICIAIVVIMILVAIFKN